MFSDHQFATDLKLPKQNMAISYSIGNSHISLNLVLIDFLDNNVDFEKRSTTNLFDETTSESLGHYIILSYTYRLGSRKQQKAVLFLQ
ncbi:hypothetical protein ITJ86_02520 [Winogradskyella sp. F6397]|uniref:Outer membrane protein beta-barrel domain-containing protein n=1 Tax=Winogradskyella marina TaxID=2785530 RepID=A0ABS0EE82_9FLAO|nr:hypothetical protein [Winogradskyella marina]MBF8148753.1 hypothetical protein [Winogradskyella marina]